MKIKIRNILTACMAIALLSLSASGCRDDTVRPGTLEAPAMPPAAKLDFDLEFFDQTVKPEDTAAKTNYVNARIRVAVIKAVTELVLTPPVAAFALAIHTTPVLRADGSFLWTYDHVQGIDTSRIRLRGKPAGDHVAWELRIDSSATNPSVVNELWFEGETSLDGNDGFWRFHDFLRDGDPVIARIDWSFESGNDELVFTDLNENPGDQLTYASTPSLKSITFTDISENMEWFIRWNPVTGTGSLRTPNYNGGLEACWDDQRNDVTCP